jgi:hypothetical protein
LLLGDRHHHGAQSTARSDDPTTRSRTKF